MKGNEESDFVTIKLVIKFLLTDHQIMAPSLENLNDVNATYLLNKISDLTKFDFYGYEKEKSVLNHAIDELVKDRKSGSILIQGGKGMGKKSLVNHCLDTHHCLKISQAKVFIIKLDGTLQTTDCATLNTISKSLQLKSVTSASMVGGVLETRLKRSKILVIFVLKNFELFCKNQNTLMYTLFDTIQNVSGILLIALTRKTDCLDSAEKRIRSRMGSRSIVLIPFSTSEKYICYGHELMEKMVSIKSIQSYLSSQYEHDPSFLSLRYLLMNLLLYRKRLSAVNDLDLQSTLFNGGRFKVLKDLTQLELAFICLFSRFLSRHSSSNLVRIVDIYEETLNNFPRQIYVSKALSVIIVARLIDYGLVEIDGKSKSSEVYLCDYTELKLNVPREEIDEILAYRKNNLPTNFAELLR